MIALKQLNSDRHKLLLIAWLIIIVLVLIQMMMLSIFENKMIWRPIDYIMSFFLKLSLGTLMIWCYEIPIYDRIRQQSSMLFKGSLFLLHGVGHGLIYLTLSGLLNELKINGIFTEYTDDRVFNLIFTDLHNAIKTYLIFMAILYGYELFQKNIKEVIERKSLENQFNRIKLDALRGQLHPHFLFNALNNVVALIDEDRKRAQKIILDLSDLLRYSLQINPHLLIGVEEELELLKKYTAIEQAKHEDQIEFKWLTEGDLSGIKLPALILQPIVENAIKHGFINHEGILKVQILATPNKISISNNGNSLKECPGLGNGLQILRERLDIHFKGKYNFRLFQKDQWIVNEIAFYGEN